MITSRYRFARCASLALWMIACAAEAVDAQVTQAELDAPALLLQEKKFTEAADEYSSLISRLSPEQQFLAERLEFNRATSLASAGKPDEATASLLKIDDGTADQGLRAAARSALAQLAFQAGEAAAESDTARAIEQYQRAERLYRNALPGISADNREPIARNIEVIQRRIAKLLEKQKQEQQQQQKQQDQNQDQRKQDQQQQDQSKSDQQQNHEQKQGDQGQQGEQKDQQDPSKGEQNKQDQGKQQSKQSEDGKQPEQTDADKQGQKADKEQKASTGQEGEQQVQQVDPRDFDRAAAEILDKERKQRERIRQMLMRMRRAAPVERDW